MENLRKWLKVRLVNDYKKYVKKQSFVSQKAFNKNFVVIHEIEVLTIDKPVYVGVSILDLNKFLIKFRYKHIGTKYDNGTSCYVQAQTV